MKDLLEALLRILITALGPWAPWVVGGCILGLALGGPRFYFWFIREQKRAEEEGRQLAERKENSGSLSEGKAQDVLTCLSDEKKIGGSVEYQARVPLINSIVSSRGVTKYEFDILSALRPRKFVRRTSRGIADQIGLTEQIVVEYLAILSGKGYVRSACGSVTDKKYYEVTSDGLILIDGMLEELHIGGHS
jgi:DNA-binding MarR family transcriptional regulator